MSQSFFAATMIALGIVGLLRGDFMAPWTGLPKSVPAREILVYLTALISLVSGVGLLWRGSAIPAARLLLCALLVWALPFRVPDVFRAPMSTGAWWALGESSVMMAAAGVLYASFAGHWDRKPLNFATGETGLRLARALCGLGLIPFGVAHFTYLDRTVSMVPAWLPWHLAWASFFGAAFIAAGVAMVIGVCARLAAALSAVQLALFTVLVWIPVIVASPTASDWTEFISSWVLTIAAWVVADSWRGVETRAWEEHVALSASRKD